MTMEQKNETFQWDDAKVSQFIKESFDRNSLNFLPLAIQQFKQFNQLKQAAAAPPNDSYFQAIEDFKQSKRQEEKPKDWCILSFKRIKGDTAQTFTYNAQTGDYVDSLSSCKFSLNSMLHNSHCVDSGHFAIHSVKRLSDGEVFSLGDKVTIDEDGRAVPIKEIRIANGELRISSAEVNHYAFHNYLIHRIKKAKPVLFTTHDGKEIFEGDEYYGVDKGFHISVMSGLAWYSPEDGSKYFSTREAAKEYILWNKPMLSLEDLLRTWDGEFSEKLRDYNIKHPVFIRMRELAKSKL